MSAQHPASRQGLVFAQILGALGVFALIALAPPAQGTMLLIPMTGLPQGEMTALALTHGASVVQRGPFRSSIIIYGERAQLFAPLARAGVLVVAGGAVGCGAIAARSTGA
jgi:hypothetical protein